MELNREAGKKLWTETVQTWLLRNGFLFFSILVVFVAAMLRFWHLFSLPLTNDETSALMRLNVGDVSELINKVVWNDGHPLLVQLFLWYWTKWFGMSIWVVKLPFIMCGIGAVILTILIGIRMGFPWAGLYAASILATLQFPLMYAQIARPYAPGLLLSLWAFYTWLRWIFLCREVKVDSMATIKPLFFLAVAGYLGASNHYFNGLILALLFIIGFFIVPKARWWRYFLPWVLMGLMYAHQWGIFLHHLTIGSPGWLTAPTIKTAIKHLLYTGGYSLLPWFICSVFILFGARINRRKSMARKRLEFANAATSNLSFSSFWVAISLYLLPMGIAFLYSVYRAPIFQDSVMLFSFPFGLLALGIILERCVLSPLWRSVLVVLILLSNSYVLLYEREHVKQFGNQSYDGAMRTMIQWAQEKSSGDGNEIWVYGFEPFFWRYHAAELGGEAIERKLRGQIRYFRGETADYSDFRARLDSIKGADLYYANMVGMDPMLRVWIQGAFPNLVKESMGAGYHLMHFSKRRQGLKPLMRCSLLSDTDTQQAISAVRQTKARNLGLFTNSQYHAVLECDLDSLGPQQFDAEFIAGANVLIDTSLLRVNDLRLVISITDVEGQVIRFLDRGLADMRYDVKDFQVIADGGVLVPIFLAGRLVDVDWGIWFNHVIRDDRYKMQIFIDNAGQHRMAIQNIFCNYWQGNRFVYGLVNPSIP